VARTDTAIAEDGSRLTLVGGRVVPGAVDPSYLLVPSGTC
jgi:hypothetical protein